MPNYEYTCNYCSKEFKSIYKNREYCSKECHDDSRRIYPKYFKCLSCKKKFYRNYGRELKFCSQKCSTSYKWETEGIEGFNRPNLTDKDRFWNFVDKKGLNECWKWQGGKSHNGYGRTYKYLEDGSKKTLPAHRLSWEIHNGPIPNDKLVLHKCDNRPCVNPKHLWLGTQKENIADMYSKGRQSKHQRKGALGEKNSGAKLTENQVKAMRELYKIGNYTQLEISEIFSISIGHTERILSNRAWKHI